MSRVDAALIESRGVAVQAAQNVISDDERFALPRPSRDINSVFAAGNSMFRDHQLLGGFLNSAVRPFNSTRRESFSPAPMRRPHRLGRGQPNQINVNGTEASGRHWRCFMKAIRSMPPSTRNSRLIDLREGKGVTAGRDSHFRRIELGQIVDLDRRPRLATLPT